MIDVPASDPPRRLGALGPFDLIVPIVLLLLAGLTALLLVVPGLPFVIVLAEADHVINSAATLAAGMVAALAWIRFTQTRQPDALFQAAAFLTLFVGGATSLVVLVAELDAETGFDRLNPGQGPLYLWTIQRLVAALLLLAGAIAAVRRMTVPGREVARLVAVGPALLVAVAGVLILLNADLLPVLVPPDQLARLAQPADYLDQTLISPPLAALQLVVAALYMAAAAGYTRLYRRAGHRQAYLGYLAVGLAVAAFSQLHYAVIPGNYEDLVTSGDVLRAVFYGLVLVGVAAAARNDQAELRRANTALIELRAADVQRVALEERSRLAREVHDGLVQELWLARLTHGRLVQMPDLPAEAQQVAGRVDAILEDALAEARQAIVALQPNPDGSFGNLLERFTEDYADRFGLEIECTVDGAPGPLSGHVQAEVLRVCREALNNARKHADATLVRVELAATDSQMQLRITDNGRGFEPALARPSSFGLRSMRERAEALDAELAIESAPMAGTKVTLTLDMAAAEATDGSSA